MGMQLLSIGIDRPLQMTLERHLDGRGWRILTAEQGAKVKRILKRKKIDVALLGLAHPTGNGIAYLELIKKVRPLTEVILLNYSAQVSLSIAGMKLGAFDDFMLPVDLTLLVQRIQDAAEAKRQKERLQQKPKTLYRRYQEMMMAASFAEAGEHQTAIDLLEDGGRGGGKPHAKKDKPINPTKEIEAMEQIKVLLVDDEEEFVKTLAERIKMRNVGSNVALNGEEALTLVKDEVPDVMVLDLKMPGIDGMEVLRRVKKAYPDVQVIMLTGHGSEKDEKEARHLGAYEYLEKPTEVDTLVNTIRKAYRNKVEKSMMAATFAEAGEYETARRMMDEKDKD